MPAIIARRYKKVNHAAYHKNFLATAATALHTELDIDDDKREVFIAVDKDYGKFLSPERADYALIAMLVYGLKNKHDITCEAPVTEELLYKLKEILIPTLVRSDLRNYPVKIQADIAPPLDKLHFDKRRGG